MAAVSWAAVTLLWFQHLPSKCAKAIHRNGLRSIDVEAIAWHAFLKSPSERVPYAVNSPIRF